MTGTASPRPGTGRAARPGRSAETGGTTPVPRTPLDVLSASAAELLRAVPADVWCAVMLDPATLLDTGGLHEQGFPAELMPRLFEIEHGTQEGVDHIRALAHRPGTVSLLSESTGGATDSVYHRDILAPADLADELRVTLKADGRTWGLLVLCRAPDSRPFSRAELRHAAAIGTPAAVELRRALLLTGIDDARTPDAPGLVVTDPDGQVTSISPIAEYWLGQIDEEHRPARDGLAYSLSAVLGQSRHAAPGATASARVRTRGGRWITINAWRQGPPGQELGYASLTPSQPAELAALVLDAYALTRRERDVTQQVLQGRSTSQIARALHITEYTVQDHLRKVFGKLDVRSRGELTAALFTRHYLPVLASPPLATDGRLLEAPAS